MHKESVICISYANVMNVQNFTGRLLQILALDQMFGRFTSLVINTSPLFKI